MTKKLMLLIFLAAAAMESHAQTAPTLPNKKRDAIIAYQFSLGEEGKMVSMGDTLLTRGSMVLEPVKVNQESGEGKQLYAYYLTDLSKLAGMKFTPGQPDPAHMTAYALENKDLGFRLTPVPLTDNDSLERLDFIKTKDTVINGDKCIEYLSKKQTQVTLIKSVDKIISTRIIVNTALKDQHYPFIGDAAFMAYFGGALIFKEAKYASGQILQFKFNYIVDIPPTYKQAFDKYETLFKANLNLLDNVKNQ